jgi:hypothetical protein
MGEAGKWIAREWSKPWVRTPRSCYCFQLVIGLDEECGMAGKTLDRAYRASRDRVWVALVRVVAKLGYVTLSSDVHSGTLSFNTGRSMKSWAGQDMSATVLDIGPGQSQIVIGGTIARTQAFGGSQVVSWGEKAKIGAKVLDAVTAVLPTAPEPETVNRAAQPSGGLSKELEELASLHDRGVLSDDEFRRSLTVPPGGLEGPGVSWAP